MNLKKFVVTVSLLCAFAFAGTGQAFAEVKVGVMNIQKIIALSDAGKAAKKKFEAKMGDLKSKFDVEQQELVALRQEIAKKGSAWSEEKKASKSRDFQKMQRELQEKNDDANFELKQLQEREFEPILKALEGVVNDFGKKNGYTVILDTKMGAIYFAESADVTGALVKELNKAMAK
ncbi:OmpH family outer membrane protein [Desulfosediminicola sp.]|uniref:OmpH family outer membrane protein n=1 Tax=Desulfosediminicola sp. TaxID=2886825 RepID=UPI003AF2DB0A